ncbi:DNA mismatch repair protein MutT [Marivirga lumbricoides]|uniref:DNA mismatch repair protein MutT n=1 Tax=Marivirga lumbricoides TaxID=1046115 RepID=A0ABQ1MSR7_9BACT|nr:DNA mismatch repair protein MutT [Marivirga lumbricoides]
MKKKTTINLPTYSQALPILVAVDCIIFGFIENQIKLLVFKREVEPYAGKWSLPGSFVDKKENISTAAKRILLELSNLENVFLEQMHSFGDIGRDTGDRVISVAYWSLIKPEEGKSQTDIVIANHITKWVDINPLPELVLDHTEMVKMALQKLSERAKFKPIGLELLPSEFTLPQLLKVYEAIQQRTIDDRNFRKKILKSKLLIQLDKKDKSSSRKGAYLYKFDYNKYKQLQNEGYLFEI